MPERSSSGGSRPRRGKLRSWRKKLADEQAESTVYRELAARRQGEEREILLELADAEQRHADHWRGLLGSAAEKPCRATLRMRLLAFLARRFGWVFVLALVQRAESRSDYDSAEDATVSMAADERIHGEVVRGLAARGRARLSGTMRAAVFGINDGLVSNFALVLGVIGGGATTAVVLLAGLSGLLAGALSMAAGEYVSVSSQRELLAAAKPDERAHRSVPYLDVDANELALVYRARGLSAEDARERADAVLRRTSTTAFVTDTAGTQEGEVVGSAVGAATSSFLAFGIGALLPVVPFLAGAGGAEAVVVAGVLSGIALLGTGATVGVLSGGAPLPRAARQLAIGAAAAMLTYLLGVLFGVSGGG